MIVIDRTKDPKNLSTVCTSCNEPSDKVIKIKQEPATQRITAFAYAAAYICSPCLGLALLKIEAL